MSSLDQVRQLRRSGKSDSEIVNFLQDQGISPREINEALSQSNIKDAVSETPIYGESKEDYSVQPGMQPSLMNQGEYSNNSFEPLPQEGPNAREINDQVPIPGQEYFPQEQYQDQGYEQYPTQDYNQYNQNYESPAQSDTITEIASQMVTEKTNTINKKISDLNEIKTLLSAKVEKIDSRLSRIESIIDNLQITLLRRSTEQEQNISDIKSEMGQMREGFSKVLDPLIDIERDISPKRKPRKKHSKKKR